MFFAIASKLRAFAAARSFLFWAACKSNARARASWVVNLGAFVTVLCPETIADCNWRSTVGLNVVTVFLVAVLAPPPGASNGPSSLIIFAASLIDLPGAGFGIAVGFAAAGCGRAPGAVGPPPALMICCCCCLATTSALNRRTCSACLACSSARLIKLGAEAPPTMTELAPPG